MTIDLNCDMGEREDIAEDRLLPLVTSANVSCGAHAGSPALLERTLRLARTFGVACGAHPAYPDPANFGRLSLPLSAEEIEATVADQVTSLARLAASIGVELRHVKPHGALYNDAARHPAIAAAIARGVAHLSRHLILVGLHGSSALDLWRDLGFAVAAEAFADRAYLPDGSLMSRHLPGALIQDPTLAAAQALALARLHSVQTLCIHGDTPGAESLLTTVRAHLLAAGFSLAPLSCS